MTKLIEQLDLARCPHCRIDKPHLSQVSGTKTTDFSGVNERFWKVYKCHRCGGLLMASSDKDRGEVAETYPPPITLDEAIPHKARNYLDQAINSIHAASASIMVAASSVDAMLKDKGYKEGSLYSRIDKAMLDGLITADMATWAHAVRLDANDQRHADEDASLPSEKDARRCIDFVMALGQFLFVLPTRVQRGLRDTQPDTSARTTVSH